MNNFKSKLPNLEELASMTSKLFTDIQKSMVEIVQTYKKNRAQGTSGNGSIKPTSEIKTKSTTGSRKKSTKTTCSDDNKKK
jgi:hypothetical protein